MTDFDFDLIVIGAGPAGLTAAQYGARAGLSVLALERLAPGGQVLLIDVLENYPGVAAGKTGFEFSEDLRRQAEAFGAKFLGEEAAALARAGRGFSVTLGSGGVRRAAAVLIATGAVHRTLGIPGEKEFYGRGVSYCAACDGPFFRDKKVFVVGGGDAACDEALFLSRLTSDVTIIHRREKFRAQKSLADRVLHNPNIRVMFNTVLKEIKGSGGKVSEVMLLDVAAFEAWVKANIGTDNDSEIPELAEESADGVFIFAGTEPQSALVAGKGLAVALDDAGYILTDQHMATTAPGLFAAGDVRATPFRQVVTAAGDGAVAAHSAAIYIDMLKGETY